MNKIKTWTAALLIGAASSSALADRDAAHNVQYEYARVIGVSPVTRTFEVSTPERECWVEQVPRTARSDGGSGSMIVGGILGGVAGNRFGGGNGKKAATVAGTIAGAMIGRELSRGPDEYYTESQERCRTVHSRRIEERVIGYDVRYRYNGQEYVTRSDRDPGERIRLRVSVTPAL